MVKKYTIWVILVELFHFHVYKALNYSPNFVFNSCFIDHTLSQKLVTYGSGIMQGCLGANLRANLIYNYDDL